jgi:hypothetical protein
VGCLELSTDLSDAEADAVLEPYFVAARGRFLDYGLGRLKGVRFSVSAKMHDSPRHFAATTTDGKKILVAPELAELDEPIVIGIIGHELGHATDFLYPGEFVLGRSDDEITRRSRNEVDERQWHRWMSQWERRDDYVVEKTADLIAGLVWGTPIGYTGPCMLESFDEGVPRPRGLR